MLFVPLVDGRVLFDTMGSRLHPVGVTYADVYDYLNCLNTSPCWGWMNTNATVRDITTQHAEALSAVYPQLVASQKYDSFTMHALHLDWHTIFAKWIASGHDVAELIEPVDGFHPSTTGSQLMAEEIWNEVASTWPDLLGPVNPNNAAIQAQFGAQGGY